MIFKLYYYFHKHFYRKYFYNKFFISKWPVKPNNFWKILEFILNQANPKTILELGSGESTLYFLKYISKNKNNIFFFIRTPLFVVQETIKNYRKKFWK